MRDHLYKFNSVQFTNEFRAKLSKGTANFNCLNKSKKKLIFTNVETNQALWDKF